jgi:hypothetical protein
LAAWFCIQRYAHARACDPHFIYLWVTRGNKKQSGYEIKILACYRLSQSYYLFLYPYYLDYYSFNTPNTLYCGTASLGVGMANYSDSDLWIALGILFSLPSPTVALASVSLYRYRFVGRQF